jgi:hypothetical protein
MSRDVESVQKLRKISSSRMTNFGARMMTINQLLQEIFNLRFGENDFHGSIGATSELHNYSKSYSAYIL